MRMIHAFLAALTAAATTALGATTAASATTAPYPTNECVASKQRAAGQYCRAAFDAWATGTQRGGDARRDRRLLRLGDRLDAQWSLAEARSLAAGSDCSETTLGASDARDILDAAAQDLASELLSSFEGRNQAACGSQLLRTAGLRCQQLLLGESRLVRNLGNDAPGLELDTGRQQAGARFDRVVAASLRRCEADADAIASRVDEAVAAIVRDTTVSPHVPDSEYATYSPTGPVSYQGRDFEAGCVFGTPYHFFAKRGSVNKLVMYYQGGGACWEQLTCGLRVCDVSVDPEGGDNPNNFSSGFTDISNPENPFRDWSVVVVSYCSCDVHYGDAIQDYGNINPDEPVHAEHRGFQNAKIVEKWAREHFVNPEAVFVTGSSAGAYGAIFHAPGLHEVWPAAGIHVLGDAGNGVITERFLQNEFENWNFRANLPPDIPGVVESIDEGTGMVGYIEAVASFFPDTNWGHYTAAFDGGSGGQTGFYNVMLNDNNPIAALAWWQGSCAFNRVMREQASETAALAPENYRYYIGSGSRHTMWGNDKVYTDTLGGVPRIVDWIAAMLRSVRSEPDPGWTNVEADPFNVLLSGDPKPDPLQPPFEMDGTDVVINCD